jgi:hypothetical protein
MDALAVTQRLPGTHQVRYTALLYNSRDYLEANNGLPQFHFYLVDKQQKAALGHIAFSIEEGEAMSPVRAPFAGFELALSLDSETIQFFIQEVQRRLREKGVSLIRLKTAPLCCHSLADSLKESLINAGFIPKNRQVYHAIEVNDQPLERQLASMEQRRLRKAVREGLEFRFAERAGFSQCFDFIKRHREAKGHRLSMSWSQLKPAMAASPENYMAAGIYQQDQLIAASIIIRTSEKVVYNFLPAHDMAYNALSPMVFLLRSLYQWCQQEQVDWIDLGTSYIGKKVNKSLVSFKEHMGGQPFESVAFRKTLSS